MSYDLLQSTAGIANEISAPGACDRNAATNSSPNFTKLARCDTGTCSKSIFTPLAWRFLTSSTSAAISVARRLAWASSVVFDAAPIFEHERIAFTPDNWALVSIELVDQPRS